MKLGSVCRAEQMLKSGPTLRVITNFYIELELFYCSLSGAFPPKMKSRPIEKLPRF